MVEIGSFKRRNSATSVREEGNKAVFKVWCATKVLKRSSFIT
jgi:hypothetical protein